MPTREKTSEQLATMLGSYGQVVAHRARFVFMSQTMFFLFFFFWRCGGMMLLGMALYKSGFLDGRRPIGHYVRVAATCLPVGLGLAWYGTVALERVRFAMPDRTFADLWNYAGAVFVSVGYAAVLILVVKTGLLGGARKALAAVGQMAFSNYLFHSVMSSVVFLGWGLGLAGRFDYAQQLLYVACRLDFPAGGQPHLAPAVSLRSSRMAVAITNLLEAAADAARHPAAASARQHPCARVAAVPTAARLSHGSDATCSASPLAKR